MTMHGRGSKYAYCGVSVDRKLRSHMEAAGNNYCKLSRNCWRTGEMFTFDLELQNASSTLDLVKRNSQANID